MSNQFLGEEEDLTAKYYLRVLLLDVGECENYCPYCSFNLKSLFGVSTILSSFVVIRIGIAFVFNNFIHKILTRELIIHYFESVIKSLTHYDR